MTKWFNPLWWNFYLKANTIYQIHSPFLFDFATNLWPQINCDPNFKRGKDPNHETSITTWINHLCRYYQIDQLIISSNSTLINSLENTTTSSLPDDNPTLMGQLLRYNVNKEDRHRKREKEKPDFNMIGAFSVATLVEIDLNSLLAMNESCLILCLDIHNSRSQYLHWKEILGRSEFSFSIELYNFGLLFKHPVNQQPEHITLISWHKKPWKIKIL